MPKLEITSEYGAQYLNLHVKSWEKAMNAQSWAVYLKVARVKNAKSAGFSYNIATDYRPSAVDEAVEVQLKNALTGEFPELAKRRQDANYRTLGRQANVSEKEVESALQKLLERTAKVMNEVLL